MDPELCALFCKEYTDHLNRLRRTRIDATATQRKELAKLERERVRIVEAIKGGLPAEMVRDDAQHISTRMEVLKRELECEPTQEPILHRAMADMYAREVQKLIKTLNEPGHREEAAGLIRGLIDRIILKPDETKTRLVVNLEGDLAGILAMSEKRCATDAPSSTNVSDIKSLALASHNLNKHIAPEVVGKAGCGSRI